MGDAGSVPRGKILRNLETMPFLRNLGQAVGEHSEHSVPPR